MMAPGNQVISQPYNASTAVPIGISSRSHSGINNGPASVETEGEGVIAEGPTATEEPVGAARAGAGTVPLEGALKIGLEGALSALFTC